MSFPDSYPSQTTSSFHGLDTATFEDGIKTRNPFDLDKEVTLPMQREEAQCQDIRESVDHRRLLEDMRQTAIGFAKYTKDEAQRAYYDERALVIEQYLSEQPNPSYGHFHSLTAEEYERLLQQAKLHKAYERSASNIGKLGVAPLMNG